MIQATSKVVVLPPVFQTRNLYEKKQNCLAVGIVCYLSVILPTWTNFTKRPDSTLQRSRCVSRSSPWIHVELQHLHSSVSWKTSQKYGRKPGVSRTGLNLVPSAFAGSQVLPVSQSRDRPARNKSSSSGELSPQALKIRWFCPTKSWWLKIPAGSWDGLSRLLAGSSDKFK